VKLGDLGVSKRVRDDMTKYQTSIRNNFEAPEMVGIPGVGDDEHYTNAVDIWALGYLVHWMLPPRPAELLFNGSGLNQPLVGWLAARASDKENPSAEQSKDEASRNAMATSETRIPETTRIPIVSANGKTKVSSVVSVAHDSVNLGQDNLEARLEAMSTKEKPTREAAAQDASEYDEIKESPRNWQFPYHSTIKTLPVPPAEKARPAKTLSAANIAIESHPEVGLDATQGLDMPMLKPEELFYLKPGFDFNSLTIPRLRSILVKHEILYPTSAKKPQLIQIIIDDLLPQSRELLLEQRRKERVNRAQRMLEE
jgi:serine/threonine protein kinase